MQIHLRFADLLDAADNLVTKNEGSFGLAARHQRYEDRWAKPRSINANELFVMAVWFGQGGARGLSNFVEHHRAMAM